MNAAKIAATILRECRERSIPVSNLKLQKLLYYAEAWSLALGYESLFPDPIEAWVHGPVVNSVFHLYKEYRWSPILELKASPSLDDEVGEYIRSVLDVYGAYHAFELERLTHSEKPWMEARSGLAPDSPSRNQISRSTMKDFYSKQVAE